MKNWTQELATSILIQAIKDFKLTDEYIDSYARERDRIVMRKARADAQHFFNSNKYFNTEWLDALCQGAQISATTLKQSLEKKRLIDYE